MNADCVESGSLSLPAGMSRRRALVAVLGASLGAVGLREVSARKKNGTKKRMCRCQLGYHCVKGKCAPDATTAPPVVS